MKSNNRPSPPRLKEIGRHPAAVSALGWLTLVGLLVCAFGTLLFLWLADEIFEQALIGLDTSILLWVHGRWGNTLDAPMLLVTTLGDPFLLAALMAVSAVGLIRRGYWLFAGGLILAAAGAGILNLMLKFSYQRLRPDLFSGPLHLTSYSFPSGHAMGALVCYGILVYIAVRLLGSRYIKLLLVVGATLLVLAIGFSRVYFGVHFPTDILGGYIAGAIWLIICILLIKGAERYAARSHTSPD